MVRGHLPPPRHCACVVGEYPTLREMKFRYIIIDQHCSTGGLYASVLPGMSESQISSEHQGAKL